MVFAANTTAVPFAAPNAMPEVSAIGCVGSSGTISLIVSTAHHSGTVSICGSVSSASRASRARSTSAAASPPVRADIAARDSAARDGGTADAQRPTAAHDHGAGGAPRRGSDDVTTSSSWRVVRFFPQSRGPRTAAETTAGVDRRLARDPHSASGGASATREDAVDIDPWPTRAGKRPSANEWPRSAAGGGIKTAAVWHLPRHIRTVQVSDCARGVRPERVSARPNF